MARMGRSGGRKGALVAPDRAPDTYGFRPVPGRVGRHESDPSRRGVRPSVGLSRPRLRRNVPGRGPARLVRSLARTGERSPRDECAGKKRCSRGDVLTLAAVIAKKIPRSDERRVDVDVVATKQTGAVAVSGRRPTSWSDRVATSETRPTALWGRVNMFSFAVPVVRSRRDGCDEKLVLEDC